MLALHPTQVGMARSARKTMTDPHQVGHPELRWPTLEAGELFFLCVSTGRLGAGVVAWARVALRIIG